MVPDVEKIILSLRIVPAWNVKELDIVSDFEQLVCRQVWFLSPKGQKPGERPGLFLPGVAFLSANFPSKKVSRTSSGPWKAVFGGWGG